jgi:carbonic anhydrase
MGMDNLNHLINHFNPIINEVIEENEERSSKNSSLLERLNHQNVKNAIEDIRKQSSTLKNLKKKGKLRLLELTTMLKQVL